MFNPKSLVGRQIDEFTLEHFIASGAMGLVYRAYDTVLKRTVALKLILKSEDATAAMSESRGRLIKEARAAARLCHENIVTVHSYGEVDDFQYITMEYVTGTTLARVLSDRGALPPDEAIPLFDQILQALEAAEREHIVHRDIKPGNIMITGGKRVKVMDFGIARLGPHSTTLTGTILGTPNYMSPEQISGQGVDVRSDLFSAGAVFYQVLTGAKPFEADTMATLIFQILHVNPTPPAALKRDIPEALGRIVLKAIAKNPAERYQTPSEMREALRAFRMGERTEENHEATTVVDPGRPEPSSLSPPATVDFEAHPLPPQEPPQPGPPEEAAEGPPPEDRLPRKESPRSWRPFVLGGLLVALAGAALVFYLSETRQRDPVPARPTPGPVPSPAVQLQGGNLPRTDTQSPTPPGLNPSSAQAQFALGLKFSRGTGVAKDDQQALRWYRKAAEQGHAGGQNALGYMYLMGRVVDKDYQEAMSWFRRSAGQGYARAQTNLGFMHHKGLGTPVDYQEAVRWYARAAEQGEAKAQYNLGVAYQQGQGVKQDHRQAVRWYIEAARQGDSSAQFNLGIMYKNGWGVQKNLAEARKHFQSAADQGHQKAIDALKGLK